MQKIKAEITIPIPENMVLISKIELEDLVKQKLSGKWWTMKDLQKRLNRSDKWIKENILYPSRFRKILDCENGGFVYYPKGKGETWSFQASRMAEFLDHHFAEIYRGE